MEKPILALIFIGIAVIIALLLTGLNKGIFSSTESTTSHSVNSVKVSNYKVKFLTPKGSPLVFHKLPNGDYYTLIRLETQTNVSTFPVRLDYPVKAGVLTEIYDNKTQMWNSTFVVVIDKNVARIVGEKGFITMFSKTLSDYTTVIPVFDDNIEPIPSNVSKVLKELGENVTNTTSESNQTISFGNNTVVSELKMDDAIITTQPVVSGRSFDALIVRKPQNTQNLEVTTSGLLYSRLAGSGNNNGNFDIDFYFGYGTNYLSASLGVNENILIYIGNTNVSSSTKVVELDFGSSVVNVNFDGSSITIDYGSTQLVFVGRTVFIQNGTIYGISRGSIIDVGSLGITGSPTIKVYSKDVIVGFTNQKATSIDWSKVLSAFDNTINEAYSVVSSYARLSETLTSKIPVQTKYYSILNTMSVPSDFSIIPTTIASGRFTENVTYRLHLSDNTMYLTSSGGTGMFSKGLIPTNILSDYVYSPNGINVINTGQSNDYYELLPELAPAGTTRFVFFGNLTYIMKSAKWIIGSKKLIVVNNGTSYQKLYQGGEYGKYIVVTGWNVTAVQKPYITYEFLNWGGSASSFCCFVNVDRNANGVKLTLHAPLTQVKVINGENTAEMLEGKYYPYTLIVERLYYVGGVSCEFATAGMDNTELYGAKVTCPTIFVGNMWKFSLPKNPTPESTFTIKAKFRVYIDHPCFAFDDDWIFVHAVVGFEKGYVPNYLAFQDTDYTGAPLYVLQWGKEWFGYRDLFWYHVFAKWETSVFDIVYHRIIIPTRRSG